MIQQRINSTKYLVKRSVNIDISDSEAMAMFFIPIFRARSNVDKSKAQVSSLSYTFYK